MFSNTKSQKFPIEIERDEDGTYIIECPLFEGCYSQGKTRKEAISRIKEVIAICIEEKSSTKTNMVSHSSRNTLKTVTL